jgi:hypothetical protein
MRQTRQEGHEAAVSHSHDRPENPVVNNTRSYLATEEWRSSLAGQLLAHRAAEVLFRGLLLSLPSFKRGAGGLEPATVPSMVIRPMVAWHWVSKRAWGSLRLRSHGTGYAKGPGRRATAVAERHKGCWKAVTVQGGSLGL